MKDVLRSECCVLRRNEGAKSTFQPGLSWLGLFVVMNTLIAAHPSPHEFSIQIHFFPAAFSARHLVTASGSRGYRGSNRVGITGGKPREAISNAPGVNIGR